MTFPSPLLRAADEEWELPSGQLPSQSLLCFSRLMCTNWRTSGQEEWRMPLCFWHCSLCWVTLTLVLLQEVKLQLLSGTHCERNFGVTSQQAQLGCILETHWWIGCGQKHKYLYIDNRTKLKPLKSESQRGEENSQLEFVPQPVRSFYTATSACKSSYCYCWLHPLSTCQV